MARLFSLEALDANNGDCLFLHFGTTDNPKFIIIDGGPQYSGASTFDSAIKPRLKEMADLLGVDLPLDVEIVMVSHIDDDHIGGVIKLLNEANGATGSLINVSSVWHNSFDDFLATSELNALASFGTSSASASAGFDSHTLSMAAGVKQSLKLRDKVTSLGIIANAGTGSGFVADGDSFQIDNLKMTVIGPARSELESLQAKFDAENPNISSMTASERRTALASFTDNSIANLASIVVLAEQHSKTMLLTGDARGDKVLEGLERANLLDSGGKISVDILKVPHHGSDRNVSTEFFRKVRAKHYVFSGDGAHGNPDTATLEMLATARGRSRYTMWFTHKLRHITTFVTNDQSNHTRNYEVEFRNSGFTSLWVDLGADLTF